MCVSLPPLIMTQNLQNIKKNYSDIFYLKSDTRKLPQSKYLDDLTAKHNKRDTRQDQKVKQSSNSECPWIVIVLKLKVPNCFLYFIIDDNNGQMTR